MSRTTRLRRSSALIRISRPSVLTVLPSASAVWRRRARSSSSASSPATCGSGGVRRTRRRIHPDARSTTRTSGRRAKWKSRIGRAAKSMTCRARRMASNFGTCSPTTTCKKARTEKTSANETAATSVSPRRPNHASHGSSSGPTKGAPAQPSPRLVRVIPSCAADK